MVQVKPIFHCDAKPFALGPCIGLDPQHHKIALGLGKTSKFPHTNHKRSSVRSHTLAPTTICDLSHSLCWRPLPDLGHKSSVTYFCHPLWFVCGHRKGILTSPLYNMLESKNAKICVTPNAKHTICVTPNASQWNIGCAGSPTQIICVGHVHFMLFMLISVTLVTQREPILQWNMGFGCQMNNQVRTHKLSFPKF